MTTITITTEEEYQSDLSLRTRTLVILGLCVGAWAAIIALVFALDALADWVMI